MSCCLVEACGARCKRWSGIEWGGGARARARGGGWVGGWVRGGGLNSGRPSCRCSVFTPVSRELCTASFCPAVISSALTYCALFFSAPFCAAVRCSAPLFAAFSSLTTCPTCLLHPRILLKGLPKGFNKDANKKGPWREKCEITGIKSKGFAIISSVPKTNDKEHAWQTRKSLEDVQEMEAAAAERLRSLQAELFSRTKERDALRKKLSLKLGAVVKGGLGGLGSDAAVASSAATGVGAATLLSSSSSSSSSELALASSSAAGNVAAISATTTTTTIDLNKEFDVDASLYPVPAGQVDAKIKEGLKRYGRQTKSINEDLVRPIVEMRNATGRSGDASVQVVVTAAHQSESLLRWLA